MKAKGLDLMNEDFLQYLWKTRCFDHHYLITTEGEPVEIIRQGMHNRDSGPDFFNARIRIGETLWAGNVEVHLRASDWKRHRHDDDEAYQNVILHVVYEADEPLYRSSGELIPTLELNGRIDLKLYDKYQELRRSRGWIPCAKQLAGVDSLTLTGWLGRMMVERLETRSETILQQLHQNNFNWDECFYRHLARYFGMKVNADPFEWLAASLPYQILAKHADHVNQVEALVFGQAGLLPEKDGDEYARRLQKEYRFLRRKYQLSPLSPSHWKFMRMRPVNFPTVRLAQFASLMMRSPRLFRACLEARGPEELVALFSVRTSPYWHYHYRFGMPAERRTKSLGLLSVRTLIINTVAPFLFVYGRRTGDESYCERALDILTSLEPEVNVITEGWKMHGIVAASAFESQALLQLKKQYCDRKLCLDCGIGCSLLKNV